MWEKVVLNLLSNAFKFTFEGEIEVSLKANGNVAELCVRDSGVGIPAEEMPRLFERFHRVSNARSRTHEGSGIGLALVQELVKLHGGSIEAQSTLGAGTTFRVRLPFGEAHLPKERIVVTRSFASTSTGAAPYIDEALRWLPDETLELSGEVLPRSSSEVLPVPCPPLTEGADERPFVLVADDNADMRQYFSRLLSERYRILAVPDGEVALKTIRAERPDLVLSDVMMPHLDGFGLVRELRSDDSLRTIPIILVSARAGEESRLEGLSEGADDYLIKPFNARELLARVEAHLKIARFRRESEERVEQVLDSITDSLQVVDAGWRLTYMNEASRRTLLARGLNPEELIGKHFWDEIFPELRGSKVFAEYHRAMNERVPIELENFFEPWRRWYSIRLFPVVESGGLAIYFHDITLRMRAEEALRENERLKAADLAAMTQLYELSQKCVDPNVEFTKCVESFLEAAIVLLGADKGNIQLLDAESGTLKIVAKRGFNRPFLEFFDSVCAGESSVCGTALQNARRIVVEDVMQSEIFSGKPSLDVLLKAGVRGVQSTPLTTSGGKVFGMISTHFARPYRPSERELRLMDLLARQAADYLERKQVEEVHGRYLRMLDSGFDAIIVRDAQDRITSWNRGAVELYGWSSGEALGQVTHSMFQTEFPKPLAEILAEVRERNRWEGELIHKWK
jgi:PAS domain S-box-containing protein